MNEQQPNSLNGRAWLQALMLRDPGRWSSRLGALMMRLKLMGRGRRRRFGRAAAGLGASAAGIALMALMAGPMVSPVGAQEAEGRATINVNNTTCTLVDAIRAANNNAVVNGCTAGGGSSDTIKLGGDVILTTSWPTYYYEAYTGTPLITSKIIIDGQGHTISRSSAEFFRLMAVGSTGDLTLRNITLSGGDVSDYDYTDGGAIYSAGPLTVENATFSGNKSGESGGAIQLTGSTLKISNSTFTDNDAPTMYGGAIFNANAATITISDSTFSGNSAKDGGAISGNEAEMTITNVTFTGNVSSGAGGALSMYESNVTATGSTFSNNAAGSHGGVLYNSGAVTMTNSVISGNLAFGRGGAFYMYDDGTVSLDGVTFTGNKASSGGAIYSDGDLTINNSEFTYHEIEDWGGVFYMSGEAAVTITNTTFLSNTADNDGGVMYFDSGTLSVYGSTFQGNYSNDTGGALYIGGGEATISHSIFDDNEADSGGGAIFIDSANVTIEYSTVTGNRTNYNSGGIYVGEDAQLSVRFSEISNNVAGNDDGGAIYAYGPVEIYNSTFSGNKAYGDGGAIKLEGYAARIYDSTFVGNVATSEGGAIYSYSSYQTAIYRSIISGNSGPEGGADLYDRDGNTTTNLSVIGDSSKTNTQAFVGVTFGSGTVRATSNGDDPTALADILETTLADNGGQGTLPGGDNTRTHNLVAGSPAVDVPDMCYPYTDQRGVDRPKGDGCDAGAVEFVAEQTAVLVSTLAAGTVDGIDYGQQDILMYDVDFGKWTKWFDGKAAGMDPAKRFKNNLNSFWISDTADVDLVFSLAQNQQSMPGITGKVDGMDLVHWDGSAFSLWFDGSDVDLNVKAQEKIDGLHVLDSAPGGRTGCEAYLLISTHGPGMVRTAGPGSPILKFGGEDVLGFCATNLGQSTTGTWEMVLDGSAKRIARNNIDSISMNTDGTVMYLTSKRQFSFLGSHSTVFAYDMEFEILSGPYFQAQEEGLGAKARVDGLHVTGDLPAAVR